MASRSQPRKGARFHRLLYIFRPSGLGIQRNRFTPGWCPGLHSYAAPRLGCCDIKELPCVFNINAVVAFLLVGAAVYFFVVSNNKEVPGVPERSANRRAALRLLHFINAERRSASAR